MALIPSSAVVPSLGYPVTEKLAKNNYPLWRAQVISALRGAQMSGYVDGSVTAPEKMVLTSSSDATPIPNPAYDKWEVKDQQVLNYLLSSLSRDILVQVIPAESARAVCGSPSTTTSRRSPVRVLFPRAWLFPWRRRATPLLPSTMPR